jgi:prepilin-type N-terminal cleavage/methylation domain-containing protein
MNLFKFKINIKKGFTLIELLVVISIVGLLSSVLLASVGTARAKARDAKRVSDMRQVQLALELYRDANGSYPTGTSGGNRENSCGTGTGTNSMIGKWDSALVALVTQKFLPELPEDPKGSVYNSAAPQFCYTYLTETAYSTWTSCGSQDGTGNMLESRNYSYVLYYSTEATPPSGSMRPWWNGNPNSWGSPPVNRCILGPLK